MLEIKYDGWVIALDPEQGSIISRCLFKDVEIFRTAPPLQEGEFAQFSASHFPLLPFSNRIEHSRFQFLDKAVTQSLYAPEQRHILHGHGWTGSWTVKDRVEDSVSLTFSHVAGDWPWDYSALQRISVAGNILRLDLSVTNESQSEMPCGLGFHPYFPDLQTASLSFESNGVWLPDADCIPRDWIAATPEYDFARPRMLKDFTLDHCFTGVGAARICWSDSRRTIGVHSSDNLNKAAVYIAHDDNCFCFEPISHTHNALNMENPEQQGVKILAPGETQTAWCEFKVGVQRQP